MRLVWDIGLSWTIEIMSRPLQQILAGVGPLNTIEQQQADAYIRQACRRIHAKTESDVVSVHDDHELDTLRGGRGLDWFFAAFLEDVLADLNRGGDETTAYL